MRLPSKIVFAGAACLVAAAASSLFTACLASDTDSESSDWTSQPSGTLATLRAVHFLDSLTGYAAGDEGTILKTIDGGETWTAQASGTASALHALRFTDPDHGVIVGEDCVVLHTSNGGADWENRKPSSCNDALLAVAFRNADTVHAVGRERLVSNDGGRTWTVAEGKEDGVSFSAVAFATSRRGFHLWESSVNRGARLKLTIDGGLTWAFHSDYLGEYAVQLQFVDSSLGYLLRFSGGRSVLRTTNGGDSWTNLPLPPSSAGLNALHFTGLDTGYAVGMSGSILRLTGPGSEWSKDKSGVTATLHGLHFPDPHHGWAVGAGGAILKIRPR